jgi:hypothetical protein
MASPAELPITIRTGDTEQLTVTVKDDAGVAVNITGRTYSSQIRATAASTAVLATFTCSVTNGTAGIFQCTMGTAITGALSAGQAVYDVQENASGVVTTLLAGPVFIVQDVTR